MRVVVEFAFTPPQVVGVQAKVPDPPQAAPVLVSTPSSPADTHDVAPASEPTDKVPLIKEVPCTAKSADGVVVPIPTLPLLSIINAVDVAEAVEVEINNRG